ncbi:SdrD B-like domain-containing protein [Amycolatopsis sp. NPDC005232]|uniref:SdrD B-like domain-containing protein n=1 Tax=Amycolatopsis sp. NPDC005232 TaxID=3157027 RepID=UPI00339E8711
MSRRFSRGVARLVAGLTTALTIAALTTPAALADDGPGIQVELSASVDDSARIIGKPFPIALSLHNVGVSPLTALHATTTQLGGSWLSVTDWHGLDYSEPGVTLDPGATATVTVTAVVYDWVDGPPQVRFSAAFPDWGQSPADLTVPMVDPTTTSGSGGGAVYGDRNGNHVFDPGEGLAGVTVQLSTGNSTFETVSGVDGAFTFMGVPVQRYNLYANALPDSWVYDYQDTTLDIGDQNTNVVLRAVRPLSDQLHATATLDRGTYVPGDSAQVTITLTNVGSQPLSGITGECDRVGDSPDHLSGWRNWSDLTYPAMLTFAPGESRTFVETGTVPSVSDQYGGFMVDCDFGTVFGDPTGFPRVNLWAHVPGTAQDTNGSIYHDDNHNLIQDPGEAVAHTAVTLLDLADGHSVATQRTDSGGHVAFTAVPAGRYQVQLAHGWVPARPYEGQVLVGTCQFYCADGWAIMVKRG